ncbi:bifunctional adenosylcobinamide kinase/adenosylcobinamide-phosphate guanylyltransferase [Tropicimonas sp.]|uniref:bifunctional adenosylcobinamide kinase/adenosylcobinamide-phosphate guanylyltransferase n=1 Tax=Tropicimonas sp. TaxID=2067044 RepID=UPI003A8ACE0B
MTPALTLVLGGASSGKSAWAEQLVRSFGLPCLYLATARPHDAEMAAKIAEHRARRGEGWQTVEAPDGLAEALRAAPPDHAILLDCLTIWLSNRLLADADLAAETADLLDAMTGRAAPLVAVSNEVGQGIVPDNALARRFRTLQGRLNCEIAARSGLVVAVMAGLPLALRGNLPAGAP